MATGRKLDLIVQALRGMQDGQPVGGLPTDLVVWDRLFDNPLANCLPVGILHLDTDFRILKFNSTFGNYYDSHVYSVIDCIGNSYFDCFPEVGVAIVEHFLSVKNSNQQYGLYNHPYTDFINIEQTYWNAHLVPLHNKFCQVGFLLLLIDVTNFVSTNKLIAIKNNEIERLKITLETVLNLKEQLNSDLEENILANTRLILTPLLDKLRNSFGNSEFLPYVDGIESVINNLGSNFAQQLGINKLGLTPKEMQIATMIGTGKTTKEIAECLHVSTDSIDFHRKNLRKKLDCKNMKANLRDTLSALFTKKQPSPLQAVSGS